MRSTNDYEGLPGIQHEYVHREVRDYFLDRSGGQNFLSAHLEASFDAQALFMKAFRLHVLLLAEVNPNSRFLNFRYVHKTFSEAASIQHRLSTENTPVIEEMLSVLQRSSTVLNHGYGTMHWTNRIELDRWDECNCDLSLLKYRCYRSIQDSLGLCAAMGLDRYVIQALRRSKAEMTASRLTHVLSCTNIGPHFCAQDTWHSRGAFRGLDKMVIGSLRLARELLVLGASPSQPVASYSGLTTFTIYIERLLRLQLTQPTILNNVENARSSAITLCEAVSLFEAYAVAAADLNTRQRAMRNLVPYTSAAVLLELNASRILHIYAGQRDEAIVSGLKQIGLTEEQLWQRVLDATHRRSGFPTEHVIGLLDRQQMRETDSMMSRGSKMISMDTAEVIDEARTKQLAVINLTQEMARWLTPAILIADHSLYLEYNAHSDMHEAVRRFVHANKQLTGEKDWIIHGNRFYDGPRSDCIVALANPFLTRPERHGRTEIDPLEKLYRSKLMDRSPPGTSGHELENCSPYIYWAYPRRLLVSALMTV